MVGEASQRVDIDKQFKIAVSFYSAGDFSNCASICNAILRDFPNAPRILNLLANVKVHEGEIDKALHLVKLAYKEAPLDTVVLLGYSEIMNRASHYSKAIALASEAIEIQPKFAEAYINRGVARTACYEFIEARKDFKAALSLNPDLELVVLGNLVMLHGEEGQYETARKLANRMVLKFPDSRDALELRSRFSMYTPSVSHEEEGKWAQALWSDDSQVFEHLSIKKSIGSKHKKILNIGYFSADIKDHPVAQFIKPVLDHHNRRAFQIFLYDVTVDKDDFGKEIISLVDVYRNCASQSDREIANVIANDRIDILIDITGLFQNNRLKVFRYRPARIQASWIGYSGTTGLPEMDYIIADSQVIPPKRRKDFSEHIVALPSQYLCFALEDTVMQQPCFTEGNSSEIIFGSFNNHMKLNAQVIRVWSEILKNVRPSMLFLKSRRLGNVALQRHIKKQFEFYGVDSSRLILSGPVKKLEHFASYNKVDIALDPFPYCGTTTTIEALAMGVPVITLVGERWVQRTSYSFLKALGYDYLCAYTEADYIRLATDLAKNSEVRQSFKAIGKSKFSESSIGKVAEFTLDLERAYHTMWSSSYDFPAR